MKLRPRQDPSDYAGSEEEIVLFDVIRPDSAMDEEKPSLCIVKKQDKIRLAAIYAEISFPAGKT